MQHHVIVNFQDEQTRVLPVVNKITPNMSYEMYAQLPGINISTLKEMARSPMHYKHRLTHPKQSAALALGTAAHTAVLEPERYIADYAIWDRITDGGNAAPRKGQFWDTFCSENQDKEIITFAESLKARDIAASVRNNPDAMKYLEKGYAEVVMQCEVNGLQRRARVDWLCKVNDRPIIVGLKTARDCREREFGRQAHNLGYHLQWAWYHDIYASIKGGVSPRMIEIVVESGDVPAVVVYEITNETIEQGRKECTELLTRLAECQSADHWPGPAEGEVALMMPVYAYDIDEEIEETGDDN